MRRRRWLLAAPLAAGTAAVAGFGAMMAGRLDAPSGAGVVASPRVGRAAPADLLGRPWPGEERRALRAEDLAAPGRPALLWFWASWCPSCAQSPAGLRAAADLGWTLCGVLWRDTPARGTAALRAWGDSYARLAHDADGRLGEAWGIFGVPEAFLIGPDGVVRRRIVGALTPERVARDLRPWA
jgi:cytochrome c biogenesis protein CcmG/thiol:disulfide interchange protein DsbE